MDVQSISRQNRAPVPTVTPMPSTPLDHGRLCNKNVGEYIVH